MKQKRALAALLSILQVAWSVSLGSYQAFAEVVVQVQVQQPVAGNITPVPLSMSMPVGNLSGVSGAQMTPGLSSLSTLPNSAAPIVTVSPSVQTRVAASVNTPSGVAALTPSAVLSGVQTATPLQTGVRAAPGVASTAVQKVPAPGGADFKSVSVGVRQALALPGLQQEAPSEASKGAGDALFAALQGGRLIQTSGSEVAGASVRTVAGRLSSRSFLQPRRSAAAVDEVSRGALPTPSVSSAQSATPFWKKASFKKAAAVAGAVAAVAGAVAAVAGAVAAVAALPFMAPYAGIIGAVGSVTLSVIGIPQIIHNFKAGREGVKDLVIASPLIWFAAAVLLSAVSIGQGSNLWWNVANLAGVAESALVVGQINYYKRDPKALKASLLTAAAVLAPIPLIFGQFLMPLSAWVTAAFTAAMGLLWVLNWPQIRQNYRLYQAEGRAPQSIAPLYPALVALGSLMHLYAAFMVGDLRWALNAIIAIVTAGAVLGQIYFPKATNAVVGPLVRLVDRVLPGAKPAAPAAPAPSAAQLAEAKTLVDGAFAGADLLRFKAVDPGLKIDAFLSKAKVLPGRSLIILEAPTAAGKSTLASGLDKVLGKRIRSIEVDRYFKARADVPTAPNGEPDFDLPDALLLDRVAADIRALLEGKRIELPVHDMKTGVTRFDSGEFMELGPDDVLVVDSIYASHGKILQAAAGRQVLNMYLAAPAVVRLARRLARDKAVRGTPIENNLRRWELILSHEKDFILPLQGKADMVLNLMSEEELRGLPGAYAKLLAEEWAAKGQSPEMTALFLDMVRASLRADAAVVLP